MRTDPLLTLWMLAFFGFLAVMSAVAILGGNRAKHRRAERARIGRIGLHDRQMSALERVTRKAHR